MKTLIISAAVFLIVGYAVAIKGVWIEVSAQDPRQQNRINAANRETAERWDRQKDMLNANRPPPDERPLKAQLDDSWKRVEPILNKLSKSDRAAILQWAMLKAEHRASPYQVALRKPAPGPRPKDTPEDYLRNVKKMAEDPNTNKDMLRKRINELIEAFPNTAAAFHAKKLLDTLEAKP